MANQVGYYVYVNESNQDRINNFINETKDGGEFYKLYTKKLTAKYEDLSKEQVFLFLKTNSNIKMKTRFNREFENDKGGFVDRADRVELVAESMLRQKLIEELVLRDEKRTLR